MWEAAQAPCRHRRNQNHDKLTKDKQPGFTSGVSALNCLQVDGFCRRKISTFLKRRAAMFEEEPADATGDMLAAARAEVKDEADDIPAFIDLSVLIRDFVCKRGRGGDRIYAGVERAFSPVENTELTLVVKHIPCGYCELNQALRSQLDVSVHFWLLLRARYRATRITTELS